MITAADVNDVFEGLALISIDTDNLLTICATLSACRAVADTGGREAVDRLVGRINAELKRRVRVATTTGDDSCKHCGVSDRDEPLNLDRLCEQCSRKPEYQL